jgi:hypothetical protein
MDYDCLIIGGGPAGVVSDLHQLAVAAGNAGIAATTIHRGLPPNLHA